MNSKSLSREPINVLLFLVNQVRICLDIRCIKKILPLTLLVRIPTSPPHFAGMLNNAGKSIAIVDLGIRLGLPRMPYTIDTPMIICTIGDQTLGMIVDKISGLALFEKQSLQMNEEFHDAESVFLGIATIENELALLLDPAFILTLPNKRKITEAHIKAKTMEKCQS